MLPSIVGELRRTTDTLHHQVRHQVPAVLDKFRICLEVSVTAYLPQESEASPRSCGSSLNIDKEIAMKIPAEKLEVV
jgi:hypothetical protein